MLLTVCVYKVFLVLAVIWFAELFGQQFSIVIYCYTLINRWTEPICRAAHVLKYDRGLRDIPQTNQHLYFSVMSPQFKVHPGIFFTQMRSLS